MRRSALLAATTVAGAAFIGSIAEGDRKSKGGGDYRPLGAEAPWTTVHENTLGLEGLTADSRGNLYSPTRNSPGGCPVSGCPRAAGRRRLSAPSPLHAVRRASRSIATASCSWPTARRSSASGRARRRRRRRPCSRPVSPAPTGSRSTSAATSGSPTAAPVKAACGGSAAKGAPDGGFPRAADGQRRRPQLPRRGAARLEISGVGPRPTLGASGHGVDHAHRPPGRQHLGSQHLVANGLRSTATARCSSATPRAAPSGGSSSAVTGSCAARSAATPTFTSNTLCLSNVFVQHPALEGADGIALDRQGNVIAAANERNAVVVATQRSGVVELFRNPVTSSRLRNEGPLEFPTSPVLDRPEAVSNPLRRVEARQRA